MNEKQYAAISALTSMLMLALDSNTLIGTKNNPLQQDINYLKNLLDPEDFENLSKMLKGLGFKFN